MKTTIFLALILTIFTFTACQTALSEQASNVPQNKSADGIKQVSVNEAKDAVSIPNAQFIDVRTDAEYKGGHAPKTVNLPLDTLEKDLAKLDKQKPVYVICQTGRRSQKGVELLQKNGFKEIYNVEGGTTAWANAGLPMEK